MRSSFTMAAALAVTLCASAMLDVRHARAGNVDITDRYESCKFSQGDDGRGSPGHLLHFAGGCVIWGPHSRIRKAWSLGIRHTVRLWVNNKVPVGIYMDSWRDVQINADGCSLWANAVLDGRSISPPTRKIYQVNTGKDTVYLKASSMMYHIKKAISPYMKWSQVKYLEYAC